MSRIRDLEEEKRIRLRLRVICIHMYRESVRVRMKIEYHVTKLYGLRKRYRERGCE